MPREGVFAKVIHGGEIQTGNRMFVKKVEEEDLWAEAETK